MQGNTSNKSKNLEKHREDLKSKQSKLTKATSHDRILGSIYATSGFTTCPRIDDSNTSRLWALDWCFIRLHDKVRLNNLPENLLEDVEIKKTVPIRFWARFGENDNYEVLKRGRSTGWTRGIISSVNSSINPRNGLRRRSGKATVNQLTISGFFNDKPVTAHTIVSTPEKIQYFVTKGDSGSFVLLNKKVKGPQKVPPGTILGLIYARNGYCKQE
ncbi:hypothetical protein EJ04DRAFT_601139 [Polyplosphaeria fusca]|uniref:Uncharacterized protein n=1 Tax=Polyplosphaeria fusca TaxID=682080 RepID=A0A9P4R1V9_9PLEO|nr:hypothetical protein EJ04DRAFT_601139 [Polyplosphaeria fusca]